MTSRRRMAVSIVALLVTGCTGGAGSESASQATPSSAPTVAVSPTSSTSTPSPGPSFDACIGSFQRLCKDRALYLAGDRPKVVAVTQPHLSEDRATLWRRDPRGGWERIASVGINDRGHMHWQWETTNADVRGAAWSFQYRIPGRGQSDVVRVRIVPPDF